MSKKTALKPTPDLQQQLQDLEAKWKRAVADYQNLEKRTKVQQLQFVKFATTGLISKLIPIIDHLDRATLHLKDSGLTMIQKQFTEVLASEGVKRIEALNQTFDPQTMECLEKVVGPDNQVVAVIENGYHIDDQVIKPAKVKVGTVKK